MRYQDFWITSATVIPVLALALVVEARAITQRWDDRTPWWIRTLQGVGWIIPLIGFAIVEPLAFEAISGAKVSVIWLDGTIGLIRLSIIVLLLGPALELLARSNARVIALMWFNIGNRRAIWKTIRVGRRIRRLRRQLDRGHESLDSILSNLDSLESGISSSGHPDCESCLEKLGEIRRTRGETQDALNGVEERQAWLEDQDREFRELVTQAKRFKRAVIPQMEAAFAEIELSADLQAKLEGDMAEVISELEKPGGNADESPNSHEPQS